MPLIVFVSVFLLLLILELRGPVQAGVIQSFTTAVARGVQASCKPEASLLRNVATGAAVRIETGRHGIKSL